MLGMEQVYLFDCRYSKPSIKVTFHPGASEALDLIHITSNMESNNIGSSQQLQCPCAQTGTHVSKDICP